MSLTAGIVGLPNVGKSTLFNAITKSKVVAANYPFATIEPNVGVVEVKDERLKNLSNLVVPLKTIYTTFEFTDIAGLVKGASNGEGLGNKFLGNIRETDAICHVVRCYENNDIEHVYGSVDPKRDIEIINYELIMADLASVALRISKVAKKANSGDSLSKKEYDLLKRIEDVLNKGELVSSLALTSEEKSICKNFNLLTAKPMIYVANILEEEINDPTQNPNYNIVAEIAKNSKAEVVAISAKIEEDLSEMEEDEKQAFLNDLGISSSGLDNLIKTAYNTLGLRTYFTVGKVECRAWTFKEGMSAPECAGIIHSDFEKGFIKAEVYSYEDMMIYQSEAKLKEAGKIRLEGKDYLPKDGDIMHFRFNV